jgi:DNA-nicking Smr family endonuclease
VARSRRPLRPEEEALWTTVKRSVQPIRPGDRIPEAPPVPPVPAVAPSPPADIAAVMPAPPPPPRPAIPSLQTLAPRERSRIARGKSPIDARIDLHGLSQEDAYFHLSGFLARAHAEDRRVVLVITGKGRADAGFDPVAGHGRGVLRRVVPQWLSLPAFRSYVLGFEEAHLAHGGSGALYVRIRRRRR